MFYDPTKVQTILPLKDHILVSDMNFADRMTSGGILLRSDDKKSIGIRPRWGRVYAVGPQQKEIKPGQWICVSHGRWTRGSTVEDPTGVVTIRRVDNKDILFVSDDKPTDDILGEYDS